jgi:hypothetical protein
MVNVREIFTITSSLLIAFASTGGSLAVVHDAAYHPIGTGITDE